MKQLADQRLHGHLRSSQCFCVTKIVAALLRKPPPRKSKPVKAIDVLVVRVAT